MLELQLYNNEQEKMLILIKGFWLCHNDYNQTDEESLEDLKNWTAEGHKLYYIVLDKKEIGLVHLGSRGARVDWLEDLFLLPEYQNKGNGTKAVELVENIVKQYSDSLYIEAAARNERAISLYRKLGYNCLNTISVRKDFNEDSFKCIRKEKIYDKDFEIRKLK